MDAVFISHTHTDSDLATQFERRLREVADRRMPQGVNVWRTANVPVGTNWREEIRNRMVLAHAFLALITESYMQSTNAMVEIGRLLETHSRTQVPIIPVVFEPIAFSDTPLADFTAVRLPRVITREAYDLVDEVCYSTFTAIDNWRNIRFPIGSGEIYLAYRLLAPTILADMLGTVTSLYNQVYRIASDKAPDLSVSALFAGTPGDRLRLGTIETGESIKLDVKTGWLPSFRIDDGELVVEIPRGAVSLVGTLILLSIVVESGSSSIKNSLDIMKTRNEIRMQQLQEDKLQLEVDSLRQKLSKADKSTQEVLETELTKFLELTVENDDISAIRVSARDSYKQSNASDGG